MFKGRVVSVGDPPESALRHHFPARQSVEYSVEEVWLGESVEKSVVVDHQIVQGSRSAEAGEERLSKTRFRDGAVLLVIAWLRAERFVSSDEDYGTLEATPENEALLRRAIGLDTP